MTRTKKILLVLVGAAAVVFIGNRIRLALLSEETLIRMRIEDMAEGFNDTDLAQVAGGVAEDYRDKALELDRKRLLALVRYLFLKKNDFKTKQFAFRVEVDIQEVVVAEAEDAARVALEVRFSKSELGEWKAFQSGKVDADLRKGEEGWQVVRTRHTWDRASIQEWR